MSRIPIIATALLILCSGLNFAQLNKYSFGSPPGAIVQTSQCDACICQNNEYYAAPTLARIIGPGPLLLQADVQSQPLPFVPQAPVALSAVPQTEVMPAVPQIQSLPATAVPCTIADKCCTVPSAAISSPNLRCGAPAYTGCICNHATNDCVINADCCSNNCAKSGVTATCPTGTCCQAGGPGTICYVGNDATCAPGSTCTNVGLAGGNGVCQ